MWTGKYYLNISVIVEATRAMFKGSMVALVTPMRDDGSLDVSALHRLIDFHIENGTDGIIAVGTTG